MARVAAVLLIEAQQRDDLDVMDDLVEWCDEHEVPLLVLDDQRFIAELADCLPAGIPAPRGQIHFTD
jgi:hypothetical protein